MPVLVILLLAVLIVTSPRGMGGGPDWQSPGVALGIAVIGLGVAGIVIGFGWMIRIYRSTLDAEARPSSWRSRSR